MVFVPGTSTAEASIFGLERDTAYTFSIAANTVSFGRLPYLERVTIKTLAENSKLLNLIWSLMLLESLDIPYSVMLV